MHDWLLAVLPSKPYPCPWYFAALQVKCHACVGGTSVREDARILASGVQVVVGTPGRVFDMLRRRNLRADGIKMFVLDEADEMLSRGFKDQIYDIFQLLPPKLQVRGQMNVEVLQLLPIKLSLVVFVVKCACFRDTR